MIFKFIYTTILATMLFACGQTPQQSSILLATTTSTQDSGLLDYLLPHFEKQTGITPNIIAVGTGKALRMAQDGDVDMILVHAKPAEIKFVEAGFGVKRIEFMYNDFVIVGPKNDPANIEKSTDIASVMQALSKTQSLFISRGDNSGTHIKEQLLWVNASIQPTQALYRQTGQGMGKTLQITNELLAYTLVDRGTWLSHHNRSNLKVLFEGSANLQNQYSAILVNPKRFKHLRTDNAQKLITWLTSQTGQNLIGAYRLNGQPLFQPNAHSS